MKRKIICLAALMSVGGASASAANLVIDGDFEGGTSAFNAAWNPQLVPGFPNSLGVSQAVGSDDPNTGLWFAWFGDAGGDSLTTSNIEQTIPTIFNESYTLTFYMAVQSDQVSGGPSAISYGTSFYATFGGTNKEPSFPCCVGNYMQPYTLYTFYYVATSTSTVLEFAGTDRDNSAVLLDSVSLVDSGAAPEPATFMLCGTGLLAAGVWRKLKR